MKKIILMSILCFGVSCAFSQQPQPSQRPARNQQSLVQCEKMKELMKSVQDHRASCEVCKTNLPQRGFQGGNRGNNGPQRER